MRKLGDLLRIYINNSGHTVYKVAGKATLNRTTLQKVLSGERSATDKLLQKLIPHLKLSPDEETKIWALYEIQQIGEATYEQRLFVKRLVESVAEFDPVSRHTISYETLPDRPTFTSTPMPVAPVPVKGLFHVTRLLSYLFLQEYNLFSLSSEELNIALYNKNQVFIHAPGSLPVIKQLFTNVFPAHPDRARFLVNHITPLLKSQENPILPLLNLEVLANILPFAILQTFQYEVSCFYTNELIQDPLHSPFPYYIIFSNAVVLLSPDGQTALPLTEVGTINYFRDSYFDSLKKSTSMMVTNTAPGEILDNLIKTDQTPRPLWTLEYQPCFTAFLTNEMIQRYVLPDIPQRDLVVKTILVRIQQLIAMPQRLCIFSRVGLVEFAATGIISDLPSCYMRPLQISDRIKVLKSLYITCQKDHMTLRLVNPVTFSIPKHLSFLLRKGHSVDFHGYNPHDFSMNYIHITETGMLDAFEDFFSHLQTSDLVYTKDETLGEIENLLIRLSLP